ncbi:MAG: Fic family protein [Candidatus Margulisiibacteriota bacterium]
MKPHNYITQLREILDKTGISQAKLASELGVTFAALNRWLNKRAVPRLLAQNKISACYKEKVGIKPVPASQIRRLLKDIKELKKRFKDCSRLIRDDLRIREEIMLELTYNSNAIEGSTLTKKQTDTIIFDKGHIADKSYIEHLEATNHAAALNMVFDGEMEGPLKEDTIKSLHRVLMQGIRSDAGKYSRHHRAIRGVTFALPAPEDIEDEMRAAIKEAKRQKGSIVERAAAFHAAFEAVHPFGDGNGRVGRILAIMQLIDAGYAPCIIEKNRKADYYEALEYAQKGSLSHLVEFIGTSVLTGYGIIAKHHQRKRRVKNGGSERRKQI